MGRVVGRLVNGRLTEIAVRDFIFPEDVELAAMPTGIAPFQPLAYDAANGVAVPLDPSQLSVDEKAQRRGVTLALAALLVRASGSTTAAQKLKAQAVIDNAAGQVLDLIT